MELLIALRNAEWDYFTARELKPTEDDRTDTDNENKSQTELDEEKDDDNNFIAAHCRLQAITEWWLSEQEETTPPRSLLSTAAIETAFIQCRYASFFCQDEVFAIVSSLKPSSLQGK